MALERVFALRVHRKIKVERLWERKKMGLCQLRCQGLFTCRNSDASFLCMRYKMAIPGAALVRTTGARSPISCDVINDFRPARRSVKCGRFVLIAATMRRPLSSFSLLAISHYS